MVNGISPGMKLIRSAVALEYHAEGLGPSVEASFTAAAPIAAHNEARQAVRLPLPQYRRL